MKFGNRTSGFRKLKGGFASGVVKMHHKHIDLGTTRKSIQRYGTGEGRY